MSLRPLELDDQRWQGLVEAIRGRIMANSDSQWTLHAPVDPGVTVLELYAYLLEQRLYWLDQVPDPLLRAILHLLGEAPLPAQPASTVLAITSPTDTTPVPAGTELRLVDADPGHSLTTQSELVALPVYEIQLKLGQAPQRIDQPEAPWREVFPDLGQPGEFFLELVLERELQPAETGATLALLLELRTPAANLAQWLRDAVEVDPPAELTWSYSAGPTTFTDFAADAIDDGSGGLRRAGVVRLTIPADWAVQRHDIVGQPVYALRIRTENASFSAPPRLHRVVANVTQALHQVAAKLEPDQAEVQIGRWLPLPGQTLVLPSDFGLPLEDSLKLQIDDPDGNARAWQRVDDFTRTSPADRVFTLDRATRTLTFGNGLNGLIPRTNNPASVSLEYLAGGGTAGNLGPARSWVGWVDPKAQVQAVSARNPVAASGGSETESASEAIRRVAADLQRRKRAVTVADYQELALSTPGVAIARAHAAPGFHPGFPCSRIPGALTLFLVPEVPRDQPPERWVAAPRIDAAALAAVRSNLDQRRLAGTELFVLAAPYRAVGLHVTLEAAPGALDQADLIPLLRSSLQRFLDPLSGGSDGHGWPFGEPLRPSALAGAARSALPEGIDPIQTAIGVDGALPTEACADTEIGAHDLVWLQHFEVRSRTTAGLFSGGLR